VPREPNCGFVESTWIFQSGSSKCVTQSWHYFRPQSHKSLWRISFGAGSSEISSSYRRCEFPKNGNEPFSDKPHKKVSVGMSTGSTTTPKRERTKYFWIKPSKATSGGSYCSGRYIILMMAMPPVAASFMQLWSIIWTLWWNCLAPIGANTKPYHQVARMLWPGSVDKKSCMTASSKLGV